MFIRNKHDIDRKSESRLSVWCCLFLLLCLFTTTNRAEQVTFVGDSIPRQYHIGTRSFFSGSDSLYLNQTLLKRGVDYQYIEPRHVFDLSSLSTTIDDTLRITFIPLPDWLKAVYGRPLPEILPQGKTGTSPTVPPSSYTYNMSRGTELTFSGAKSFRFSARSAGNADFGQSLDLSVSGQLSPGLNIEGAISDRGYDPAYGVANSRLNELDKIHLQLTSSHFAARVGDIELRDYFVPTNRKSSRVSGVTAELSFPSWQVFSTAARPKGLFRTTRFMGADGQQGPYPIRPDGGPIVPASEQVWLDGRLLERGVNNDYTMDYSTGRITFNVNHPIDRRSRIEIDYEPQASDYRKELFSGGGAVSLYDSTLVVAVEWLREGDDKAQLLTGELSSTDKQVLASVGDSTYLAVRSGVVADTAGNYILVTDSLPDSVYQFVGTGNGDYTIAFSFVGSGKGSYRFLGNEQYLYTGPNNGDYLPFVSIPVPERIDYYKSRVQYHNRYIGDLSFDIRQSSYDKNLLSDRDDNDNNALYYELSADKRGTYNGKPAFLQAQLRLREAAYHPRSRLYRPDFVRDYFLPEDFSATTDERLYSVRSAFAPLSCMTISPLFSRLRYRDEMVSDRGGLQAEFLLHKNIQSAFYWNRVRVNDLRYTEHRYGNADTYNSNLRWQLSQNWQLSGNYKYDSRVHSYTGDETGTRFHEIKTALIHQQEQVELERYIEDSLVGDWRDNLRRTRLAVQSTRQYGSFHYSSLLSYQWLQHPDRKENNFLGRLAMQYNNAGRRLQISTSYLLSDETRRARGITYLKVGQGQGNYILENGEYLPDPDGNYILVEELLSDEKRLTRGEKLFQLNKDWKLVLLRLNARIEEELLESGNRNWWWVLPFYSDESQPYQFYNRRYNAELRLFPVHTVHVITMVLHENREQRLIGGTAYQRQERRGEIKLKQPLRQTFFEEGVELFTTNRDSYFSGSGDIHGMTASFSVRQLLGPHEFRIGSSYRRAKSAGDEMSKQYMFRANSRFSVKGRGELQFSVELYRQSFSNVAGVPSFVLTDNRPGTQGGNWSIRLRYGVKKGLRLNFNISGRHADNRAARIVSRGEMVAEF